MKDTTYESIKAALADYNSQRKKSERMIRSIVYNLSNVSHRSPRADKAKEAKSDAIAEPAVAV
ncbi:hypothetical protein BG006_008828 [Podila minutissima]|uniref:Uncharacterized protein n=1 Tax=Podila minutissima TaxID=64525 RepID=A0A9P5VJN7_9FUNG|nr:hypothetical protein BG006_008828 [Podila minutissima]